MAITYSTNLKLTLIGTGDQAGTWGNTTNTNLGTLIEQAIAGYVSQTVADSAGSPTSLSIADGTSSAARNMVLVLQGALSAARDIILPTSTKLYFIHNNTSGGFAVTAKCSGQTGVSIPNGAKVILACNGTDIVEAFNYSGSLIFPTSATITTLSGTTLGYGSASITNASIASGTVTNLRATTFSGGSASITNADIDSAVIGILTNTTFSGGSASITTANFASGTVTNLLATTFSGGSASITTASVASGTVTNLLATTFSGGSASITTVTGTTFGTTGASQIRGASGAIGQLTVTSATITNLNVTSLTTGNFPLPTSATIATLSGTTLGYASASITTASIASGTITNLLATTFSGGSASITTVTGTTFGTTGTSQIRGASGAITQFTATSATITTIASTSATITNVSIGSGVVSGNFNAATASGNVGIGTTSPVSKLEVKGTGFVASSISGDSTSETQLRFNTNTGARVSQQANQALIFDTNATERMRIDSAGNVGIGTTSPDKRLDIEAVGSNTAIRMKETASYGVSWDIDVGSSNAMTFTNNAGSPLSYIFSNGKVLVGAGATASLGKLVVSEASSGTAVIALESQGSWNSQISTTSAGNFIFTNGGNERMRINSSGNLGIGTASPAVRLDVAGGEARIANDIGGTFGGQLKLVNSASGATNTDKSFRVGPTGNLEIINSAYNAVPFTFTDAGILSVSAECNAPVFKDVDNSAFFLDPNNTGTALNVAGAIQLPNNKSLFFRNAANTASASFLLQSDDNFVVYNAAFAPIISFGQGASPLAAYGANSNNRMLVNGSTNAISFNTNGTEKVTIDSSGNFVATGNVTAYSDIRVKDNVENITGAIGKLNQIRGVTYTRIDLDDKERKYAGVIAQEIEQVLPEAVFDNGKVKSVDYNATIALLIEAVKEQQGQINELKLTIEQLKGN